MTSPSKRQQRAVFSNETATQFETLYIKNDIMISIVVVVAAARLNITVKTVENDNQFDIFSITYERNANRRKSTRQSLMEVKSEKTLSIRQDIRIGPPLELETR